jgi:aminoglycoside phosphotransferase (APT) family kinase protein
VVDVIFVSDSRAHVMQAVGAGVWEPLPGRDGVSRVHAVDDRVVKVSPMAEFEATMLSRTLEDVHAVLAPHGLAPSVELICYDGSLLGTVFSRIDGRSAPPPTPKAVGGALARCHTLLADLPARWSTPWVGFYGEYQEFRSVVPAVEDDELRELGIALLPHARRRLDDSVRHYVHRDLHPANVVAGPHGPCFVDWDLVHVGTPLDDLAMTALMWAAESTAEPSSTVGRMLAGYRAEGGRTPELNSTPMRQALAVAGLRQGIGGWFTDEGRCDAPYWPYIRRRIRTAVRLIEV